MRRRDFIGVAGGAALWPLPIKAQSPQRSRRVAVLQFFPETDQETQSWLQIFRDELERLGWRKGQNIEFEERWASSNLDRLNRFAAELVSLNPDVIFCEGTPVVAAVKKLTATIPTVFVGASNPVGWGFVETLHRPGGNMTGFVTFEPGIGGKWLETLKEVAPNVSRVGLLFNPDTHSGQFFGTIEAAAASLALSTVRLPFRGATEIEQALAAFAREPGAGLLVLADTSTNAHRHLIVGLSAQNRLPAVYAYRFFVKLGGLVSYGPDRQDQYRRAADYVDRVLRGEDVGQLPVQSPVKFETAVNMSTARHLGIALPLTLLARADEVIE